MTRRMKLLLMALAFLALPSFALAQGWGTIKGQVVWNGKDLPKPMTVNVDKDQQVCLKNGPVLSEELVVDKDTKGVRWVVVWLVHPKNPAGPVPIAPHLQAVKQKEVSFDQPCCAFEPHVLAMREGQTLVAKNSAPIPHNVFMIGIPPNPTINQAIPPGGKLPIENLKAGRRPTPISCTIHGWMKMYVGIFKHPYFAVTDEKGNFEIKDAPAGDWNLVVWHETGYVVGDKNGVPVSIKAGETSTVEPYKLNPK